MLAWSKIIDAQANIVSNKCDINYPTHRGICLTYCDDALKLDYNDEPEYISLKGKCFYQRGISLLCFGDFWGAQKAFRKTLELNDSNEDAKNSLSYAAAGIEYVRHPQAEPEEDIAKLSKHDTPFAIELDEDCITYSVKSLWAVYDAEINRIDYHISACEPEWTYSFLPEGISLLFDLVFPPEEILGTMLFEFLQMANFGFFTNALHVIQKRYPERSKLLTDKPAMTVLPEILFHVIVQRYLGNTKEAYKVLVNLVNAFPSDEEATDTLFWFEIVHCRHANGIDCSSLDGESQSIDVLHKIEQYRSLPAETHFEAKVLIARDWYIKQGPHKSYEYILSLSYIGNPMYKGEFWLFVTKLGLRLGKYDLAFKTLTLSSFSVLKKLENVALMLKYYKYFAVCCERIGNYKALTEGGMQLQVLLYSTLWKNDHATAIPVLCQYEKQVAKVLDTYENIYLNEHCQLSNDESIPFSLLDLHRVAWDAFRYSDRRISLGYVLEHQLLMKTTKLCQKTLKIAEGHAYIAYSYFGLYDYGEIFCKIFTTDELECKATNVKMHKDELQKRLAAVLFKPSYPKILPTSEQFQTLEYFKLEQPHLYSDFIKPTESYLSEKNISRILIVLHEDFAQEILPSKQRLTFPEKLQLSKDACYIEYSICRLTKHQLVCYVVFSNKDTHVEYLNIPEAFNDDIRFLEQLDKFDEAADEEEQKTLAIDQLDKLVRLRESFYNTLVRPIEKLLEERQIKTIKIIAEERLQIISFVSLSPGNGIYLIDKFEISHVLSASYDEWCLSFELNNDEQLDEVALFTTKKIHSDVEKQYGLLDENEESYCLSEEVERLPEGISGRENRHATKKDLVDFFNNKTQKPNVFHWCGHTLYVTKEQEAEKYDYSINGCLVTENSTSSEGPEDTLLYSRDIAENYDLSPIKLAFLNSCNTIKSRKILRNGHLSLARACYIAGASCVIGTSTTVMDEGVKFSDQFYEEVNKGQTIGKAFAKALRTLRKKSDSPETWSYFVLFGNSELRLNVKKHRT